MIEIRKYTSQYKLDWDHVITRSRNGSFLFYRDYMDYHSDRFNDYSFVIFKNGKMEAVLPGNINNTTYYSHQGLTYGGLVSTINICTIDVIEIFRLLNNELHKKGVEEVIYKSIPTIYHTVPCQEDIYALYLNKAEKIGCNIATAINMNNKVKFKKSRNYGVQKSKKELVTVIESDNFLDFWEIITTNLILKYNRKPTHDVKEISLLKSRFPENIKLYLAKKEGITIAGTVLFISKNIIHVQYMGANPKGKETGALDLIFDELINRKFSSESFFDFGISTENMGNYLNENLIFQKEGFGGRGIVYDIYRYRLNGATTYLS